MVAGSGYTLGGRLFIIVGSRSYGSGSGLWVRGDSCGKSRGLIICHIKHNILLVF